VAGTTTIMNACSEQLEPILQHWNLKFQKLRNDLSIAGSPERCLDRTVIEEKSDRLFILEEISHRNAIRKEEIAGTLSTLSRQGLPTVHPYILNTAGQFITEHNHRFWSVRPYIEGTILQRPDYVEDGWRGKSAAAFLKDLKAKSDFIPTGNTPPFSIVAFISDFLDRMESHNEELIPRIAPIREFLDREFFAYHDRLATAFCHGDYHPVNIVWSENAILSVIDWEFSGFKPELYDMALMIGCIGMEDPTALTGPFVQQFIHGLAHVYSPFSLHYLFEFVLAVRFAWLSEWLRNNDKEMVDLEMDYMSLLLRESQLLQEVWSRCLAG
jgi:homoserine kinase type II